MPEAAGIIIDIVRGLIERRGDVPPEIHDASTIGDDLGLDSLDLAELSAALEDRFGRDPYTAGIVPSTVGELTAYFA
ncbi:MAG: phosphopantetheine-binding protein [Solirubrobacteraceae bacterium]|nr:phosphopantetheine-binding protein [Solirubrobacteraceae bacterium]